MSTSLPNTDGTNRIDAPSRNGTPAPEAADAPAELDRYFAEVYDELVRIAHGRLSGASPTLDTVAIVHEAYAKLRNTVGDWEGPHHVRAVACRAMRQIVCNYLRDKQADKRGGEGRDLTLDDGLMAEQALDVAGVLDLNCALEALEAESARQARVVELRFFGGYEGEEIAEVLGVSTPTVKRDWRKARLFLRGQMEARREVENRELK